MQTILPPSSFFVPIISKDMGDGYEVLSLFGKGASYPRLSFHIMRELYSDLPAATARAHELLESHPLSLAIFHGPKGKWEIVK